MDATAPSAVTLKNVARRFVTPAGEILSALEDFDLSIAPGEFFAIVGPTGCGKSTTLGLIAGLAKPQAGEVALRIIIRTSFPVACASAWRWRRPSSTIRRCC
jgi:NitT/TauT family transport system ATP-binding protein